MTSPEFKRLFATISKAHEFFAAHGGFFRQSAMLSGLFAEFIDPLATEAATRSGILRLAERGSVFLLPAVRNQLSGTASRGSTSTDVLR
jgi:hypothetical protein